MTVFNLTAKSAVNDQEVLILITPISEVAEAVKLLINQDRGEDVCTIISFEDTEINGNNENTSTEKPN